MKTSLKLRELQNRLNAPLDVWELIGEAADELDRLQEDKQRLRGALEKIAKAWPCSEKNDMRMVASDAIGLRLTIEGNDSCWAKD